MPVTGVRTSTGSPSAYRETLHSLGRGRVAPAAVKKTQALVFVFYSEWERQPGDYRTVFWLPQHDRLS